MLVMSVSGNTVNETDKWLFPIEERLASAMLPVKAYGKERAESWEAHTQSVHTDIRDRCTP